MPPMPDPSTLSVPVTGVIPVAAAEPIGAIPVPEPELADGLLDETFGCGWVRGSSAGF